jgi:hypothetical protein
MTSGQPHASGKSPSLDPEAQLHDCTLIRLPLPWISQKRPNSEKLIYLTNPRSAEHHLKP